MSSWNIGADHDSDEVVALKSTISVKENEIAMLKDQLVQSSTKSQQVDVTLSETNYKLRLEADRRTKLEEDVRRYSEECQNQKTARENVELALNSVNEKLKESEKVARDLQATMDLLVSRSEEEKARSLQSQLTTERENGKLTTRLRELESECRQLKASTATRPSYDEPPPVSSDPRTTWLEQENDRLRQLSASHEKSMKSASDKMASLQASLAQAENEKVANERRMQVQLDHLQAELDEREEELVFLRQQAEDDSAAEREQQLMNRIDEDQAKIEQLVKLVNGSRKTEEALIRVEAQLKLEIARASAAELKNADLVREKEEASNTAAIAQKSLSEYIAQSHTRERELVQQGHDTNFCTSISHDDTTFRGTLRLPEDTSRGPDFEGGLMGHDEDLTYLVHSTPIGGSQNSQKDDTKTLQRLLVAIDRIRGERDGLRRQLDFSQMEHRFAVEAWEARFAASSVETPLKSQDVVLHAQTGAQEAFHQKQVKRWGLALTASSIVINRLESKLDRVLDYLASVVQAKEDQLSQAGARIVLLEAELVRTNTTFGEVEQQRIELLSRVGTMEEMLGQSGQEALAEKDILQQHKEELTQVQSRLVNLTQVLSDVETERDSLNLRVQHLETDLGSAQQELTVAQNRYSSLQAQKISSMTSNAATRNLKQQIEELEGRVMRRTEQIGLQQHDIRRMETNLRLQEDRITEMTVELETLSAQKEAMVEDCAEAREARDLALQQAEAMEMKVEAAEDRMLVLEQDREKEVASLVCVVADTVTRTRGTVLRMKKCLYTQSENLKRPLKRQRQANDVESDRSSIYESEASRTIDDMQYCLRSKAHEVQQAILAFALSQQACGNHARSLERMAITKTQTEAKIHEQHDAIVYATNQISSLQCQLRQHEEQPDQEVGSRIADLEDQIRNLHWTASEVESRHERVVAELTRGNDQLRAQTEQDTEQMQSEEELRQEIHTLNAMHAEEVKSLHSRIHKATAEFAELQREQNIREDKCQQLQRELDQTNDDLRSRIGEMADNLQAKKLLEGEFAEARRIHQDHIDRLQKDLDTALQNLEEDSRTRAELKQQHDAVVENLVHVKESIQARLDQVQAECAVLQRKLDEEVDGRERERGIYQDEIRCAVERSHNTEAGLHQEITTVRVNLERTQEALRSMTDEKNGLEAEMTNLEAEIQRSLSLRHYLEKQVKEGESEISALREQLAHVRTEYAHLEKNWSAAEVQLSLQNAQHTDIVSSLKRQLESVRNKPNLDAQLAELQEKYNDMEELLKAKCVEVEATDDKYLEVLQERRKLNTRLDNVNRKVQILERKLAGTEQSVPNESEKCPTIRPVTPLASSSRPSPSILPESSSRSRSRVVTGPTPMRSKTPESKTAAARVARPPPSKISRDKTAQPISTETTEPPVSIGKKRRAPDDFDACEAIPAQVFTADSEPIRKPELTPRARRHAGTARTGFTPVRAKPPSTDGMRVSAVPPMITDVTNSTTSRTTSQSVGSGGQATTAAGKRSWLRNLKTGQPTQ